MGRGTARAPGNSLAALAFRFFSETADAFSRIASQWFGRWYAFSHPSGTLNHEEGQGGLAESDNPQDALQTLFIGGGGEHERGVRPLNTVYLI